MIGALQKEQLKEQLLGAMSGALARIWKWIVERELEAEHIAMALVIMLSTWHVGHYMHNAEKSALVSSAMGLVLGLCNALFAMRYFEAQGEHRKPALVGMIMFAGASTWLQYGFYNENDGVTKYIFHLWNTDVPVNFNAFVQGAWAPAAELIIGWLYGTRLKEKFSVMSQIDSVRRKMQAEIDALASKFSRELSTSQALRDQLSEWKKESDEAIETCQSKVREEGEKLSSVQNKYDSLLALYSALREEKAALGATVKAMEGSASVRSDSPGKHSGKFTGKLSTGERRHKVKELAAMPGATVSGIALSVGASRPTVREDLAAMGIKLEAQNG